MRDINEYKRNCPTCGEELVYSRKSKMIISEKENRKCRSCSGKNILPLNFNGWKRKCLDCGSEIIYSRKDGFDRAEKEKRKCLICSMKLITPWNKGLTSMTSEKIKSSVEKISISLTGRKLSKETIQKIEQLKGIRSHDAHK